MEKVALARQCISQGLKRDTVLEICGLSKHQYYHKPNGRRSGPQPSLVTLYGMPTDRIPVPNRQVIEQIKSALKLPWVDYGHRKITFYLQLLGYWINHKKVFRLMKEKHLLRLPAKKPSRSFVKYRKVCPRGPLSVLEMDIKMIWIESSSRFAFVLTVLDTFTRVALSWKLGYHITQHEVKAIWEHIIECYLQPADMLIRNICIEIRNDNGSQFLATAIQAFFKENHLVQCFTHPYTPQENGHIESFHAILDRALTNQTFWDIQQSEKFLSGFYDFYNNRRIHSSTVYLPPVWFWELWDEGKIKIEKSKNGIKFKPLFTHYELSGNKSQREVVCINSDGLDGRLNLKILEEIRPEILPQPSVQKSPSVVVCDTKVNMEK